MQISKSQLGNKKLESIIEDERVEYCTFENEEYSNNLYENEFEHCEFNNIILQSLCFSILYYLKKAWQL